ncbi:hypothetical protein ANO11243_079680 [Dothideomycetidae sp. 11243]|nr:hypothetical protein ANO11243_079680 [fungal sp. No.11243]
MADVRSLLKSERANRRIVHPFARYSDSGKLTCSLCDIVIKVDSAWKGHIRTPDHAKRALRAAEASAQQNNKKRKADSESDSEDTRKRKRGADTDSEDESVGMHGASAKVRFADAAEDAGSGDGSSEPMQDASAEAPTTSITAASEDNPDDDPEWLELQRMVRETNAPASAPDPYLGATISAAPMTAGEVAAQAREEQSTQRQEREAEEEADMEDAAQALEDEFDEMNELEERVRRLREKREALRSNVASDVGAPAASAPASASVVEMASRDGVDDAQPWGDGRANDGGKAETDDDDDGDDEEQDVWNFGAA